MNANLLPIFSNLLISAGYFLGAYLLGAIPVAWLVARWATGRDLRQMGSGNVGVMNTALSVARWAGLIAFLGEIAKGVLAVQIPSWLGADQYLVGVSMVGAVIGTRWPVWLGFKGGRGNTTGLAACALVSLPAMLLLLLCWAAARVIFNKSFTATRLTLLALPVIFWLSSHTVWLTLTGLALSLLYLHAQQPSSDDHSLIKRRWPSFWSFLTSPPRHQNNR